MLCSILLPSEWCKFVSKHYKKAYSEFLDFGFLDHLKSEPIPDPSTILTSITLSTELLMMAASVY